MGELDTGTADQVFGALRHSSAETGVTVLVVTHDAAVSEHMNRTIAIRDGRISTEVPRRRPSAGRSVRSARSARSAKASRGCGGFCRSS